MSKSSMRWLRIFCAIAGSTFFFPVSCTIGTAAGIQLVLVMNQKDVQKGDVLPRYFAVVAEPGEEGRPFRVFYKEKIPPLAAASKEEKEANSFSFRMSVPKTDFKIDDFHYSYQVLEDTGQEQFIELIGSDDDYTVWSRYKATKSAVTPLSLRVMGPGEAMLGGLSGLAFAFLLNVTVNIFRPSKKPPQRSGGELQ
jgi:hypothetical protein